MNENNCPENREEQFDTLWDGLLAFLNTLPKEAVKMLNIPKYKKMLFTAARLKDILAAAGESGRIDVDFIEEFNAGVVTAEASSLTVCEPRLFSELLADVDNFEVYPLTNGNVKIDFTFQSVTKIIG